MCVCCAHIHSVKPRGHILHQLKWKEEMLKDIVQITMDSGTFPVYILYSSAMKNSTVIFYIRKNYLLYKCLSIEFINSWQIHITNNCICVGAGPWEPLFCVYARHGSYLSIISQLWWWWWCWWLRAVYENNSEHNAHCTHLSYIIQIAYYDANKEKSRITLSSRLLFSFCSL